MQEQPHSRERAAVLDSWKEIAAYLNRGITTVQRWERLEGLPVRRQAHAKRGSVYAFKSELEAWRASRAALMASSASEIPSVDSIATSTKGSQDGDPEADTDVRIPPANAVVTLLGADALGARRWRILPAAVTGATIALLLAYFFVLNGAAGRLVADAKSVRNPPTSDGEPAGNVSAIRIPLQKGTATFSQSILGGPFSPSQAIDRYFSPASGWTIARGAADVPGSTGAETAVWQTVTDVTAPDLTFTMHFLHFNPKHLLGRFRFSVTSDSRDLFADEMHTGGNVDADWVVLQNPIVKGPRDMTFTTLRDQSILAGGVTADQGVYRVKYTSSLSRVTGIRLETMKHASLPGGGGPGLYPPNGNFFLTEIEMTVSDGASR